VRFHGYEHPRKRIRHNVEGPLDLVGDKLKCGQPNNTPSNPTGLAGMSQAPTQSLIIGFKIKLNML
jgi:hypothetical protein